MKLIHAHTEVIHVDHIRILHPEASFIMCCHKELIDRLLALLRELARTVHLQDCTLRFTVDGGWLVKIHCQCNTRICRPAKRDAVWGRPASTTDAQLKKVAQHTTPELDTVVTSLTGNYGYLEAEFARGRIISIQIKKALSCAPRPALCH